MKTILDFEPNGYERYHLGLGDDTDEEILSLSEGSQILTISRLLAIRGDAAGAKAWLEKLPADDPDRIALEELRREWDFLPYTPPPEVKAVTPSEDAS
jgi:hypothetical protein